MNVTPTTDAAAWLRGLADEARAWVGRQVAAPYLFSRTEAYVDLLFAFTLARVGDGGAARELMTRANEVLDGVNEAHTWLLKAYEYRIVQALDGKLATGPLPTDQLDRLEGVERLERYVVDRLRKHSRILEPEYRVNPYRHWGERISEFEGALSRLSEIREPGAFRFALRETWERAEGTRDARHRLERITSVGLNRYDLAGAELTRELAAAALSSLGNAIAKAREPYEFHEIAHTLSLVARAAECHRLDRMFLDALGTFELCLDHFPALSLDALEGPTGDVVSGLFSLNLCDEADQFLNTTSARLLGGRSLETWQPRSEDELARLRCLLALAGGWFAFGWDRLAAPVMRVARSLCVADSRPRENREMLIATLNAVRLADRATADAHFRWLFAAADGVRDTYTTSSHFSLSVLEVVEALALAAVEVCARR